MSEARFQPVADLLDPWREDVLSGKPPTLYPIGSGELARIEIGPGLVTLIGGAPGQGKTALTMQMADRCPDAHAEPEGAGRAMSR